VNLTAQQRTQIQQTVLAGSNVPRVNNVNFAVSVGTVVPTSVRVVDVAPALIEINPAWRGHQYFVVRDDILIVDHSRKIVAVVPVWSGGGAQLGAPGAGALNLTEEQIRQVQIVLNEKGFNIGRPDGRLGSRTREALMAFQRQQGFQASGRIDNQTISALGLSNKIGAQGGATTGQGGAAAGQGDASQQAPAQQNQGASQQPSTSGQGSGAQQQAPAQQNQGANQQPSTPGQGGGAQQQAPAQQNQGANQSATSGQGDASQQQNRGANQPATSGAGGEGQQQAPAQQNQGANQNQGQQNPSSGSK